VSNSFIAKLTVSETVYDFDSTDIITTNASLSNFTQVDPLTYNAKISPINNSQVKLNINANSFYDIAGNFNNAFSDSTIFFLGIKTFTFPGISIKDSIVQSAGGGTIISYLPYGTNLDSLIATYTLSDSSTAYIGANVQVPGITKNDFKTTVNYTIKAPDNTLSKIYSVTAIINKNTACKLLTYGFNTPAVTGSINQTPMGGTVSVTVPNGTSLINLIASFTTDDSTKVYIGNIVQVSGVNSNDFSAQLVYKVVAQDTAYSKIYYVNVNTGKSKSCDMLSFAFLSPAVTGIITPAGTSGGSIALTLPYGSSLNNLISLFAISDSATAYIGTTKQISGSNANNFTTVLNYKIIAQDTNYSKIYSVTATIAKNAACELLNYKIVNPSAIGTISPTNYGGLVNILLPFGTNLSSLIAQFTLSDSAKAYVNLGLQQSNFSSNNYSDTIMFIVKSQDGVNSKLYKIIADIIPNTQCDLISFKFNAPAAIGIITPDFNGGTVAITVPFSTNLTNLIADFTLSDSAKASIGGVPQISKTTANDFTNPITYSLKAQNNINIKTYIVTVTKSTGVELKMNNGQLTIFPNPARNELKITNYELGAVTSSEVDWAEYRIINAVGKIIRSGDIKTKETTLDISDLASGIYYFQAETKRGLVTEKFVKE
jgi:hypothetical protein